MNIIIEGAKKEETFLVDGSRLTVYEEDGTWAVVGGRPKRKLVTITGEGLKNVGKGGLMGMARRCGLETMEGKALKLLFHLAAQDIEGKWYIGLGSKD